LNIEANEPSLNYGLQVSFFSQLTHVSNVAAAAEKKCPFVGLCFFFPMAFVGERRERERERAKERESKRARENRSYYERDLWANRWNGKRQVQGGGTVEAVLTNRHSYTEI
jgi:hypothetical protein